MAVHLSRPEDALPLFERAIELNPTTPGISRELRQRANHNGTRVTFAEAAFVRAILLRASFTEALMNLVTVRRNRGNLDEHGTPTALARTPAELAGRRLCARCCPSREESTTRLQRLNDKSLKRCSRVVDSSRLGQQRAPGLRQANSAAYERVQ